MIHPFPSPLVITNYARCCCSLTADSWAPLIINHRESSFPIISLYHTCPAGFTAQLLLPTHSPHWPAWFIISHHRSVTSLIPASAEASLLLPEHSSSFTNLIISHRRSLSFIVPDASEPSLLLPRHSSSLTSMVHIFPSSLAIINYSRCCWNITVASWAFLIFDQHDTNYSRCCCSIAAVSSAFLIIDKDDSSFPIITRYKSIAAAETSLLFPEHSSSLTRMIYYFSSSLVIINYGRCCCSITAAS